MYICLRTCVDFFARRAQTVVEARDTQLYIHQITPAPCRAAHQLQGILGPAISRRHSAHHLAFCTKTITMITIAVIHNWDPHDHSDRPHPNILLFPPPWSRFSARIGNLQNFPAASLAAIRRNIFARLFATEIADDNSLVPPARHVFVFPFLVANAR